MTRGDDATELSVAVVRAVARSLGEPVALPVLHDERLGEADVASEVVAAASYHAVLPLLWAAIDRDGAPDGLRAAVHDAYLPHVARALKLRHLLHVVDDAFTQSDVRYAVYKGPSAARYYRSPEQRTFADIDILVDQFAHERVDDALSEAGLVRGWMGVADGHAEAVYYLAGFGTLDLHWHVMRERAVRESFALDTAAMLDRAERVSQPDVAACVLDAVDELIAVATHACFDGAYRLGWFVDVARLMRPPDFDHHELRKRCAATGTSLPVQVVLDRAHRAFDVRAESRPLARGAWRRLLGTVAAARPVERSFRQAGRGGLAFRATRPTSARSFVALSRLVVTDGIRPLVTDRDHRWRTVRNRRT
jgi:hypothetical protein